MKEKSAYAVVMAGGKGERFWPLSNERLTKPFFDLIEINKEKKPLIELTIQRIIELFPPENILIVLGEEYIDVAKEKLAHLPEYNKLNFIVEPFSKDTAACIGFASLYLERMNKEAIMVVLPADHFIPDKEKFINILKTGIEFIETAPADIFVLTLGIKPTRAESGYGYIEQGERLTSFVYKAAKFIEKPKDAEKYAFSGKHYWNSGIFIWKNSTIQSLIKEYMPEHWNILNEIRNNIEDKEKILQQYKNFSRISVDFGILEKLKDGIAVVIADFFWDDIGCWTALERILKKDAMDNINIGNNFLWDTNNCIIYSTNQEIVTFGVNNLVVVQANDKILITTKDKAAALKNLLKEYEKSKN